jgi:hypothetical protein
MAANMVKNILSALKLWPIASVTVWMDKYGGAVLDLQSREIMESVCEQPCEKDRRNHSRDRNNLETLSNR